MALLDQPKKNFYKFRYYLRGGLNYLVPPKIWQRRLDDILRSFDQLSPAEQQAIMNGLWHRIQFYMRNPRFEIWLWKAWMPGVHEVQMKGDRSDRRKESLLQ